MDLNGLSHVISLHFSKSELRRVCFKLDVNYENIPGETLNDFSMELVLYFFRRNCLEDLINLCKELRPQVDWPGLQTSKNIAPLPEPQLPPYQPSKFFINRGIKKKITQDDNYPEKTEEDIDESIFFELDRLLSLGNLKEADRETSRLILKVTKRTESGWLRSKDISEISCNVFRIIDELWGKYSNSKFGSNSQIQIWSESMNGSEDISFSNLIAFSKLVGWIDFNGELKKYDDLNFKLDAPSGHLPTFRLSDHDEGTTGWGNWKNNIKSLLKRSKECFSFND